VRLAGPRFTPLDHIALDTLAAGRHRRAASTSVVCEGSLASVEEEGPPLFELKPLRAEAVPAALAKAERYRLLNEPEQAESICQDVLRTQPGNQQAVTLYVLAITDGFQAQHPPDVRLARALLDQLASEYDRAYYAGIVDERLARAKLEAGGVLGPQEAYEGLRRAMQWYAQAETLRPAGNDDAVLRWNSCARVLMENPRLRPTVEERGELRLE
jgi:hypothetical protein